MLRLSVLTIIAWRPGSNRIRAIHRPEEAAALHKRARAELAAAWNPPLASGRSTLLGGSGSGRVVVVVTLASGCAWPSRLSTQHRQIGRLVAWVLFF